MKPTMQTYIHNSTDVLRANLSRGVELTKAFVEAYRQAPEGEILLIASGSSYNSCVCARRWMEKVLQQSTSCHTVYVRPLRVVTCRRWFVRSCLSKRMQHQRDRSAALDSLVGTPRDWHHRQSAQ